MTRYTLLLASAYTGWLRRIAGYLARSGYTVHAATSRDNIPGMAESLRPDCILLDACLPVLKVEHCCALIKENGATRDIPIIIIASYTKRTYKAYVSCRAEGIVERSSNLIKIRAVIRRLLGRRHWERGFLEKGDLRLDAASHLVYRKSKPFVKLPPEQFRFFSLLVKKSPGFLTEEEIIKKVLNKHALPDKGAAIRALVFRLRINLGDQLARRIKNRKFTGWVYREPRYRGKYRPRKA